MDLCKSYNRYFFFAEMIHFSYLQLSLNAAKSHLIKNFIVYLEKTQSILSLILLN